MSTQQEAQPVEPRIELETTSGPHVMAKGASTRRIMIDVLIGLIPVTIAALWYFRGAAVQQIAICLIVACATEWGLQWLRGKPNSLGDGSALITALILAYSLPPGMPLYGTVLGSFIAVALGKMAFGGLGHNLFNPAMVGRAFLMVCFPVEMTTWAEPIKIVHATTQATPLAAAKFSGELTGVEFAADRQHLGQLGRDFRIDGPAGWLLADVPQRSRLAVGPRHVAGVSGVAMLDQTDARPGSRPGRTAASVLPARSCSARFLS